MLCGIYCLHAEHVLCICIVYVNTLFLVIIIDEFSIIGRSNKPPLNLTAGIIETSQHRNDYPRLQAALPCKGIIVCGCIIIRPRMCADNRARGYITSLVHLHAFYSLQVSVQDNRYI